MAILEGKNSKASLFNTKIFRNYNIKIVELIITKTRVIKLYYIY